MPRAQPTSSPALLPLPSGEGGIWPLTWDPQAALGLQGLKGSLQRWGVVGVLGGFLDIKQLLQNF